MYTLIGSLKTRAFRVAWMLNELGQTFEHDPSPPRNPKLADINPSLKVPVLKDGDEAIIDSVAICQYLADKHGQLTFPAGTISRAHQDSFTQFSVDDVELSLWVAAKHSFALPEELRVPDVKRACHFDFDRAMTALSTRLADRQFVMGENSQCRICCSAIARCGRAPSVGRYRTATSRITWPASTPVQHISRRTRCAKPRETAATANRLS